MYDFFLLANSLSAKIDNDYVCPVHKSTNKELKLESFEEKVQSKLKNILPDRVLNR